MLYLIYHLLSTETGFTRILLRTISQDRNLSPHCNGYYGWHNTPSRRAALQLSSDRDREEQEQQWILANSEEKASSSTLGEVLE